MDYHTGDLISLAAKAVKELPVIHAPSIRSTKVQINMSGEGVETAYAGDKIESYGSYTWKIPDVLGYIQSKTELTRSTIAEILTQSDRMGEILINPQLFLDLSIQAIKRVLHGLMIDGIKYQKIGGSQYEMTLFESQELEIYLNDFSHQVKDPSKTIYEEHVPLDSGVENRFAQDCESSEQVKFYFKLPSWFKIPTPIGNYNPDWALVFEGDNLPDGEAGKIYFVAETKETGTPYVDLHKLSTDEQMKIKCGKAHFDEFDDLEYRVVNKVGQLTN